MNKAILQVWEESNRNDKIYQDGCSIHIDMKHRDMFINTIYENRDCDNLPESYERIVGNPSLIVITDELLEVIEQDKSIRLRSHEMNNLLNLEEIILIND